jgi:hypothetical protein
LLIHVLLTEPAETHTRNAVASVHAGGAGLAARRIIQVHFAVRVRLAEHVAGTTGVRGVTHAVHEVVLAAPRRQTLAGILAETAERHFASRHG